MLQRFSEYAQRAALAAAIPLWPHSRLRLRAEGLRWKHRSDPEALAAEFGLPAALLRDQQARGLDVPGYRFARDGGFYRWLNGHRGELAGMSWLDVGADTGCVSAYMAQYLGGARCRLCDIRVNPRHNFFVESFDGTALRHPDAAFDIVLLSFVLHHAAGNTIRLLLDAARIARRHVLVLEDPRETAADDRWAHEHDARGTFRSLAEWRALFRLTGFTIAHEEPLSDAIHSRHFFHLRPAAAAPAVQRPEPAAASLDCG